MGMGYVACMTIPIPMAKLEEQFPMEWGELMESIPTDIWSLDDQIQAWLYDDLDGTISDNEYALIHQRLARLRDAFYERFGVELLMDHHNQQDNGSRYDEVEDGFFLVDWNDVYQFNEKGQALNNTIPLETKGFVSFG